jgi:multiple sugar transport system ATP-binding protein
MIAGLEHTSAGDIVIDGRRVNDLPPVQRGIAMVFQSYALYPHMSVFENIAFPLRVEKAPQGRDPQEGTGRGRDPAPRPAPAAAARRQLSGGQRQRVAIGRAIVREPEIFLFDEPLSNLDAALRADMRIELTRLHKQLGATMIYVTHDQIEAMTMADRIVVLNAGYIAQVGAPLELYHKPDNTFVAGFIGSPRMNVLPAVVAPGDGRTVLIEGDAEMAVALPHLLQALQPGRNVSLGLRPQHLRPAADGVLKLLPDVVEQLGDVGYLHGLTPGGATLVAQVTERLRATPMQEMRLAFDPACAFLFDSDEQRLR